jgi:hypothetical protein
MTARHSHLFTLESGQSGLRIYTSQRDAAAIAALRCGSSAVELIPEPVRQGLPGPSDRTTHWLSFTVEIKADFSPL